MSSWIEKLNDLFDCVNISWMTINQDMEKHATMQLINKDIWAIIPSLNIYLLLEDFFSIFDPSVCHLLHHNSLWNFIHFYLNCSRIQIYIFYFWWFLDPSNLEGLKTSKQIEHSRTHLKNFFLIWILQIWAVEHFN